MRFTMRCGVLKVSVSPRVVNSMLFMMWLDVEALSKIAGRYPAFMRPRKYLHLHDTSIN